MPRPPGRLTVPTSRLRHLVADRFAHVGRVGLHQVELELLAGGRRVVRLGPGLRLDLGLGPVLGIVVVSRHAAVVPRLPPGMCDENGRSGAHFRVMRRKWSLQARSEVE